MAEPLIPPSVDAIDPVDDRDSTTRGLPTGESSHTPRSRPWSGSSGCTAARGVGLLWTLALVGQLSIADYGLYTVALRCRAPSSARRWTTRGRFAPIRESEEDFVRERVSRYILGVILMAAGAAMIPVSYFVGFMALAFAGGEITFNSYITGTAATVIPTACSVGRGSADRQRASGVHLPLRRRPSDAAERLPVVLRPVRGDDLHLADSRCAVTGPRCRGRSVRWLS